MGRRWHLQYLGLGKDKEKWDRTCLPSQQLQHNNDILFNSLLTGVKCNYQSVKSDWVSASHRDSNTVNWNYRLLEKNKKVKRKVLKMWKCCYEERIVRVSCHSLSIPLHTDFLLISFDGLLILFTSLYWDLLLLVQTIADPANLQLAIS